MIILTQIGWVVWGMGLKLSNNSEKLGQTWLIEISMELRRHAGHYYDVYPHVHKHAHILAFIHAVFLHSQDHITIKLHQIRDIEVSTESGGHAGHDCCVSMYTSKNAHMLVGCPK